VVKDLGLAVDLARSVGVPAEMSALVEQIMRRARALYGDGIGELAGVRLYEDLMATELRFAGSS
jgi:3-hydroxyisobutyrate dehydrogenase